MVPMKTSWIVSAAISTFLLTLPVAGQAPRTPDGKPDFQGVWTNATVTPLERPAELSNQQFFTKEQAAQYAKGIVASTNSDRRDGGAEADVGRAYNNFWRESGTKVVPTLRTSLIVDPADGRIPALTPEAQRKAAERAEARRLHPADGPEDRSLQERCILWPAAGPPMMPVGYNSNYQIVQDRGYVAVISEMIHDGRIIPTDGSPHLPSNVRQWLGDPRGHWEGETLVVDSTNFTDKTNFRGSGESLHLVERFTRTGPESMMYEFTVDDPATFVKPWTVQVPMTRSAGPILEYACNEGNYAMQGILAGARATERAKQ
jgi:hypothetical protein